MKIDNNTIKMQHIPPVTSHGYSYVLTYSNFDIENIFNKTPHNKNKYNETLIVHYLTIYASGAV